MNGAQPPNPSNENENVSQPTDASSEDEIVIKAEELFQGGKEVQIQHGDEVYRLIITRNNKLILHQ